MKFQEYLEQTGRRYLPKDAELEPAFNHLIGFMRLVDSGTTQKDCLDAFLQSQGMDARPKMERTLRLFGNLSSVEKDILLSTYAASGDSSKMVKVRGSREAGAVLRGFKTVGDPIYDELKERWEMRYRAKDGSLRQDSVLVDANNSHRLFIDVENIFPTFTRKYKAIPESEKDRVLAHLSNLYLLGEHPLRLIDMEGPATINHPLRSILVQANKKLPEGIEYVCSPEMVREVFPHDDQRLFIIENRDNLLKKFSSMSPGKRSVVGTIAGLAFQRDGFKRFSELSDAEIDTLYRAYSFAWGSGSSQFDTDLQFTDGMRQSLIDGTVEPWAQSIIDHFRKGTIGGSNYRTMEGQVA